MIVCFIHFHHIHSLFGVRTSLSEPAQLYFWRPLWPSALDSRLVRLMLAPVLRSGCLKHVTVLVKLLQLCWLLTKARPNQVWNVIMPHGETIAARS